MAPHGMAPMPLPMGTHSAVAELSGGVGATSGRTIGRSDLGLSVHATDWFAMEARGQYLHVSERTGTNESGQRAGRTVNTFLPYLRPAFFAGPVSFALPISGFALGGGGGGVAAGMIGASVGLGGRTWNIFSGVQWQSSEIVSSGTSTSRSRELCFGGRYAMIGDFWRVSIDPQLVVSTHRMKSTSGGDENPGPTSSYVSDRQLVMGLIQLSVAFGEFHPRGASHVQATGPQPKPLPPPPPTPCERLCESQARLPCGVSSGRCQTACEARTLPVPCRSVGDSLLRCEASSPVCVGSTLVFPPCTEIRNALQTCLQTHATPEVVPRSCAPDEPCDDGGPRPIKPGPLKQPKSLGEVPQ